MREEVVAGPETEERDCEGGRGSKGLTGIASEREGIPGVGSQGRSTDHRRLDNRGRRWSSNRNPGTRGEGGARQERSLTDEGGVGEGTKDKLGIST